MASGSLQDGGNVQLYGTNHSNAQRLAISYTEDGYAAITNMGSGKALDVNARLAGHAANVQQYSSNESRTQKWIIGPISEAGQTTFCIRSAVGEGLSLDIAARSSRNGTNAQLYSDNISAAQRLTFLNISPSTAPCENILPYGWFNLVAISNPAYVVDIVSLSHRRSRGLIQR